MKNKPFLFLMLAFVICFNTDVFARSVIPSGEAVGVTIKTDGLLVTDITEITSENGHSVNAAYKAGVKKGDRIMAVDGNILKTNEELANYVINRHQKIVLTILRKNKTLNLMIEPVKTESGYKIGLWVRDSAAGIGTITCIDKSTGEFVGLGHGISDVDTNDIMTIRDGNILKCSITSPTKGEKGKPGELNGVFSNELFGKIYENTNSGIKGKINNISNAYECETAKKDEISTGKAQILSNVDGAGVKLYNVEIQKIMLNNNSGKDMIIKVTDSSLIEKTGGIVQGMSGSPILQNGKIVGAVTHVFVNDPTRGYGIFIENMLSE